MAPTIYWQTFFKLVQNVGDARKATLNWSPENTSIYVLKQGFQSLPISGEVCQRTYCYAYCQLSI